MRIQDDLGRLETHYTTIVQLVQNMLEVWSETKVRNIVQIAVEEAIEVHNQEKNRD